MHKARAPRRKKRRANVRNERRPFLIDIEDFETVEELEMDDWMFGSSEGGQS
jgi:hypothetical protein